MIKGYHGTWACHVDNIKKEGFKFSRNDEHWLGNGVYFFLDSNLAKWWATDPSKNFGPKTKPTSIYTVSNKPAVLKVDIDSSEENTFDTRNLSDYMQLVELYPKFLAITRKKDKNFDHLKMEKKRCAFFDWLNSEYEVSIIIAGFNKPKKDSKDNETPISHKFSIPYIEYQVCVFDNCLISNIERVDFE